MNYEEWKRVEYIKYDSRDGFGAQIAHLNGIQPFAEKCGLKIIIDFRVWPFFINKIPYMIHFLKHSFFILNFLIFIL